MQEIPLLHLFPTPEEFNLYVPALSSPDDHAYQLLHDHIHYAIMQMFIRLRYGTDDANESVPTYTTGTPTEDGEFEVRGNTQEVEEVYGLLPLPGVSSEDAELSEKGYYATKKLTNKTPLRGRFIYAQHEAFKRYAALRGAYLGLPQLDLTYTPTGFAVGSGGGLVPASAARVDALREQLRRDSSDATDELLRRYYKQVQRWPPDLLTEAPYFSHIFNSFFPLPSDYRKAGLTLPGGIAIYQEEHAQAQIRTQNILTHIALETGSKLLEDLPAMYYLYRTSTAKYPTPPPADLVRQLFHLCRRYITQVFLKNEGDNPYQHPSHRYTVLQPLRGEIMRFLHVHGAHFPQYRDSPERAALEEKRRTISADFFFFF